MGPPEGGFPSILVREFLDPEIDPLGKGVDVWFTRASFKTASGGPKVELHEGPETPGGVTGCDPSVLFPS